MNTITLGQTFRSNQTYRADRDRYDVTFADTTRLHIDKLTGDDAAFRLDGLHDVTLDFGGAMLYLHGKIQPIVMTDCSNITIKNLIVKYDRAPYTEGEILEAGEGYLRIRPNPNHPFKVEDGEFIPYSDTWENRGLRKYTHFFMSYDKETGAGKGFALGVISGHPDLDPNSPWVKGCMKVAPEMDGEDLILRGENIPACFEKGAVMAYCHELRDCTCIAAHHCRDLVLENVRLIDGVSMGVYFVHVENVTIDGLKFLKDELSSGYSSNGADALHTFACSGKFEIRNSVFEGMIDDALNIHSSYYEFTEAEGNTIKALCKSNDTTYVRTFGAGDVITVLRGRTLEEQARYTVKAVEILDKDYVRLTVDRPVEAHQQGDAIRDLSTVCDLHIENCRFGQAGVAHLRFQNGGKTLVEHCKSACSFCLTGDMSYWFESDPVEQFTVRDTAFTGWAQVEATPEFFPTAKEPYYHKTVDIQNCTFEKELVLDLKAVRNTVFKNNRNTKGITMKARLTNCGEADCDIETERVTKEVTDLILN